MKVGSSSASCALCGKRARLNGADQSRGYIVCHGDTDSSDWSEVDRGFVTTTQGQTHFDVPACGAGVYRHTLERAWKVAVEHSKLAER